MNLNKLKKGQLAVIIAIDEDEAKNSFLEYGLLKGKKIALEREVYFGGPKQFIIGDNTFFIRRKYCRYIKINKLS